MARQFGQAARPSGRAFGEQGSLTPDTPSLLERRDAVSRIADSQRVERNLYKRVFRGLNRRLRKGDTQAGQEAIRLLQDGKAAGIQMTGIPSADKERNAAAIQILDFQQNAEQAGAMGQWTPDGDGGSTFTGVASAPSNEVISGPNDGGNASSQIPTTNSVSPQNPGFNPNTATSQILSQRRANLAPGASPIFSSRDPNAVQSSPGLPPLDTQTEGPTGDTIIRGDDGSIIGRGSTRPLQVPQPEPTPEAAPEGPEPFADFSEDFVDALGNSLEGANRAQAGIDIAEQVRSGALDLDSLTPQQRDLYEEGDEYLFFKEEEQKVGREEALTRAANRHKLRVRKKREAEANKRRELEGDAADSVPGGILARAQPRNRILNLLS